LIPNQYLKLKYKYKIQVSKGEGIYSGLNNKKTKRRKNNMESIKINRQPIYGIEDKEEVVYITTKLMKYSRKLKPSAYKVYLILVCVCAENRAYESKITDKELAKKCQLSTATINRALRELEKYKFIERKQEEQKRRKIILLDY
jgi:hypothetical protein